MPSLVRHISAIEDRMNFFQRAFSRISFLGPGLLVAATGVGAGDLATATLTGAKLGTAILWAVVIGAALKYLLNEGLTRWQLATGLTLLEGASLHLGRWFHWVFIFYLAIWSYLVAMALMSACGVTAQAIFPIFEDPSQGKVFYGILQSLLAAGLVLVGGYSLFEKVMGVCIAIMFSVVCWTAFILRPSAVEVFRGMLVPTIPQFQEGGLEWTIALLGGVGGTVTVLCYGYWIREEGRSKIEDLSICRMDLATGYIGTAFFGIAMVIIGSQLGQLDAKGALLIVRVAETLQDRMGALGSIAKWSFLVGAWGAVFSSLLGVWQSIPYLFADYAAILKSPPSPAQPKNSDEQQLTRIDSSSRNYRIFLSLIAVVPISGLFLVPFATAMKINGIVGALFIPMLATVLMLLNGNANLVGKQHVNSMRTTGLLVVTLLFFLAAGAMQIAKVIGS
jgi:Mn2+/Fe2+ NRAMP family transporter